MIFITPFDHSDIDFLDLVLEGLSLLGFLYVLLMTIKAKQKNKIFAAKPFPILVIAIGLGLISAIMDFLSELFMIEFYSLYKLIIGILQITSLLLFSVGMFLLFRFTTFLLGDHE